MGRTREATAVILLGVMVAGATVQTVAAKATRHPVRFVQPTSIELEPAGTLLLVENNPGRLLRVDPRSGHVTVLLAGLLQPYSVVRTRAGGVVFSAENAILRMTARKKTANVAHSATQIGPVAGAADGAIYYTTATAVVRAGGGSLATGFSNPHGLAVERDGALLVADTGNDRIVRVDPANGKVATFAHVAGPRGLDVASDGTVYVVDSGANRVLHLTAHGARLGYLARTPGDLYDVQAGRAGAVYVLEAGDTGFVRRITHGKVTTVSSA